MRKIINGKLYDTNKAKLVASVGNGYYGNDFHRCVEDLYRTSKGAWFLHGEGGPLSKYGKQHGSTKCGSSELRSMETDEVVEWLENHNRTDALLEYFPDRIEEA